MNKKCLMLLCMALVWLADFGLPVFAAQASDAAKYKVVRHTDLRAGPGNSYPIIGKVRAGELVKIRMRKGQWDWIVQTSNQHIGWLPHSMLTPFVETAKPTTMLQKSAPPRATEKKASPAPEAEPTITTPDGQIVSAASLRRQPSGLADIVGWVSPGDAVEILARKGTWVQVRIKANGKSGWLPASYLAKAQMWPSKPKPAPTMPPQPTVKTTAPQQAVKSSMPPAPEATISPAVETYRVVQAATMRTGPAITYRPVAWPQAGDHIEALDRRGDWVYGRYVGDGRMGWIHISSLVPDNPPQPPARSPVATPTPQPTEFYYPPSADIPSPPAEEKKKVAPREPSDIKGILPVAAGPFSQSQLVLNSAQRHIFIRNLRLAMNPTDAEVLFLKDPFDKSSFPVRLLGATTVMEGSVKVIGSATRKFPKKSLKVTLKGGGEWRGEYRFVLRAMASDPSMMREWLSWQMMRDMGMVVPDVEYVRVRINDRDAGVFLHIQWVGPEMLADRGLGQGELFHPDDAVACGDLTKETRGRLQRCWMKLSPDDNDYSSLRRLVDLINKTPVEQFDAFVAQHFNAQSLIDWLAVNVLTSQGDTYNKNYFLFHAKDSGKWTVIPWDYDLTFGRNWDPYLPYPHNIFNDNFQYYYPPEAGAYNTLKEKTWRNPRLRARIFARIQHLLGMKKQGDDATFGWFSPIAMSTRIRSLAINLEPYLAKDPFFEKDYDYRTAVEALEYYAAARANYLRTAFFGPYPWNPEKATWRWDPNNPPKEEPLPSWLSGTVTLQPGQVTAAITDPGYGRMLAQIWPQEAPSDAIDLQVDVEGAQPPRFLPRGIKPGQCIQRSWLMLMRTPGDGIVADVRFEYMQENSKRHELGANVDEKSLVLWASDGNIWRRLTTRPNPLANTLTARRVWLDSSRLLRFVACNAQAGTP